MCIRDSLIALLFFLGVFYFVRTYKSIQNQNPDRPSVNETLNQTGKGETATLDEEDDFEEYGEDGDTSLYEPDEPTIDDLTDLNETRAGGESGSGDGSETSEIADNGDGSSGANGGGDNTPDAYNSDSGGRFLVIAGTFKQEINAQTQLKNFKKMGYDNAEVGKFNKSTFASLIVDRFNTSSDANQLVRALKAKGIDAYVHEKR